MNSLPPKDKKQAQWCFSTIRTGADGKFKTVKYSDEYKADLEKLSKLLKDAAAATDNASLTKFLSLRADAFLSNDYLAPDFAVQHLPRVGLPHAAFRPDRFARARHGDPGELHPGQGRFRVAYIRPACVTATALTAKAAK